ncbi:MAG TPA: hypothetical protein VGM29_07630 [Polyangiaceae bacterium]
MNANASPIIVMLLGVGLQLPPTDAAGASGDRPRSVVQIECCDSGTAEEAIVSPAALVPSVTITDLARQRAPNLAAQAGSLISTVQALASEAGVRVREVVLRGDWTEEGDAEHFRGVVLDIFAAGGVDARLGFWGAVSEALEGHMGSESVELSVMVHAC